MTKLFKMAIRDLARNPLRSFFSSLALGIGLSLLLLMASVVEGEMRGGMESAIKLESGHLQVRANSYEEEKSSLKWEDLIENPDDVAAQVASLAAVKAATPRLFASGIVSKGDNNAGVRVIGIDPTSAASAPYQEGVITGQYISADDRDGILIGEPLAEKMSVQAGDSILLLVNTADGEVDEQPFVVRGIYSTKTPSYDESNVFLPMAKAQAIAGAENHASTIFVLLNDRDQAENVASALQSSQYEAKTFKQLNVLLSQFEQLASGYMIVLYLIVLAITATVIVLTLVMSVFERTREIGILAAIGMKGGRIMAMFLIEGALLALGGILLGLVMGLIWVWYATNVGIFIGNMGVNGILLGERIYGYLTLDNTITLTMAALVVTLLASIYPAVLAARLEPVEALHSSQ